ncbi:hypothetical protein CR513_50009, partial [Mucuna pruriens]
MICLPINGQPQKLGLLQIMFSHLFTKEFVKFFNWDVCQFLKYHSDVWGPASNSKSGVRWFVSFIDDCTCVTLDIS